MKRDDARGGREKASDRRRRLIAGFVQHAAAVDAPLMSRMLHRYAELERLSWQELANTMECTTEALDMVALCRPPREDRFLEDVEEIARGLVDPDRLIAVLRQVRALEILATGSDLPAVATGYSNGLLMAARDRESPAGPEPSADEEGERSDG